MNHKKMTGLSAFLQYKFEFRSRQVISHYSTPYLSLSIRQMLSYYQEVIATQDTCPSLGIDYNSLIQKSVSYKTPSKRLQ